MPRIANFVRGNQLFEHDTGMFLVGFKWPLLLASLLFLGILWFELETGQSEHDAYLVWMRVYATGYMFLELPANKLVSIADPLGTGHLVPMSILRYYPPVALAWVQFKSLVWTSLGWSAGIGSVAALAYLWFAERYGHAAGKIRHVRGAKLVSAQALNILVKRMNLAPHLGLLKHRFGWRYRFLSLDDWLKGLGLLAYRIAGIDYPLGAESRHTMVIGSTGSGKTQTLLDMVAQVRERGCKAVIFDVKGDYVSAFYDPTRDVILNPADARCPAWSIFDECHTLSEFSVAAEALIPNEGSPEEGFWINGARTLFVNYCMEMQARGTPTNADLSNRLMTAPLSEIHAIVKHTPAGILTDPLTEKMANSVRAVFNTNARGLQMLPTQGPAFSVRQWVRKEASGGSILFLSTQFVDVKICRQLLTLWIDTALITLMSGERSKETALWFFVDELAALHRLPTLKAALESARSYGGAVVLGCHSISQIREVYGKDAEQTITSLTRTKLFLAMADEETARHASEMIGTEEIIDVQEGATIGLNSMRDARSLSHSRTQRVLKMAQEIRDLESLSGYLKFPEGLPAAPVIITPVERPILASGYIERASPPLLPVGLTDRMGSPGVVPTNPLVPSPAPRSAEPVDADDESGRHKREQNLQFGLTAEKRPTGNRKGKTSARQHAETPHADPELPLDPQGPSGEHLAPHRQTSEAQDAAAQASQNTLSADRDRHVLASGSGETSTPARGHGAPAIDENGTGDGRVPTEQNQPVVSRDPDQLDFDR